MCEFLGCYIQSSLEDSIDHVIWIRPVQFGSEFTAVCASSNWAHVIQFDAQNSVHSVCASLHALRRRTHCSW